MTIAVTGWGCSELNVQQRRTLQTWEAKGYKIQEADENTAFKLGFLPGGAGAFYTGEYARGAAELILWPLSMTWSPIVSAQEAETRNYFATRQHVDELQQKELKELATRLGTGEIGRAEYTRERERVRQRYSGTE